MDKAIAPYGSWHSPLSAATVSVSDNRLRNLQVDGAAVYWVEIRPAERGRGAVVRWTAAGGACDVTPPDTDVGSRVHEYGGGEYRCARGMLVFSDKSDGSVWLREGDTAPRRIAGVDGCRYADFEFDFGRRLIYAVCEDHRGRKPVDPANRIVALELDPLDPATNAGRVVFDAADFAAVPRLSLDGSRLAWICWDHPNMPWDHTRLLTSNAGAPYEPRLIAGASREAIEHIAWSSDGELYFISDRSGWANVYAYADGTIRPLYAERRDFGRPLWQLGGASVTALAGGRVLATRVNDGTRGAVLLAAGRCSELPLGQVQDAPQPFGAGAAFIAEPADGPAAVRIAANLRTADFSTIRTAAPVLLAPDDISLGTPMTVPVGSAGELTHAFFYAPRNVRYAGPDADRPPLIVTSHGGPTSMRTNAFSLGIQFWTTRGFAVADVNYRGSTGFGTAYRRELNGEWGVADVADCVAVAQGLIAADAIDPARVAIRGGSSSGFTTLAALAASRVFRAGASYYPITDLRVFIGETHKFESRYIDGLIGPPEAIARYIERSPAANVAAIVAPVALFQGLDDNVVPPNQSELMVEALRANGTPVEYHPYAGEAHGFLKARTVQDALEAELAFYGRSLDIPVAQ